MVDDNNYTATHHLLLIVEAKLNKFYQNEWPATKIKLINLQLDFHFKINLQKLDTT